MQQTARFQSITGLAHFAQMRARRSLYNGKFGLSAQRVIERCTHGLELPGDRLALVTYVREAGAQACGWWAQPQLGRARRLSVVYRDRADGAVLGQDVSTSIALVEAMFGDQVDRVWCETPPDGAGRPVGTWHFRLFCDARGRAAPPQGLAFTRENAGCDWIMFGQLLARTNPQIRRAA